MCPSGDFGFALGAGGTGNDFGYATTTDAAGNVYATGSFQNTVDFDPGAGVTNLTSLGGDDVFIAKYTSAGALIWAKNVGGGSSDIGTGIAVDAAGNVYTTGYFASTNADFNPGIGDLPFAAAGQDIFVCKLDPGGGLFSAQQMGGSGDDRANAITLRGSNFYLTGWFSSTADFDNDSGTTTNLTSAGDRDIFTTKYTIDGELVWAKRQGGVDRDEGYAVAVDSSGNVHTTGSFSDTADFNPDPAVTANLIAQGASDAFVSKLHTNGTFVWAKSFAGDSVGRGIGVDSSGNVLTTGSFGGTVDFNTDPVLTANLVSAGADDVFVTKLDIDGNHVWAKRFGSGSNDAGNALALDATGNVHTSGFFGGTVDFDPNGGAFELTSAGSSDVFISQLDNDGDFVVARSFGGSGADIGNGIASNSTGAAYTTGSFSSTVDFDPSIGVLELTSNGGTDIFVAKLLSNAAPTDIALSNNTVAENLAAGTVVGTFSTTDPGDTHAYALVAGEDDDDNAAFTITGNALETLSSFNFESNSSYNIRVRSSDIYNQFVEDTFTINVSDIFEPATQFSFSVPPSIVAGQSFNVTVTALDASDNVASAYAGTVQFTSSDPQAVLPPDTTLVGGTGSFPVTLKSSGTQSVSVDADSVTGASSNVAVSHGLTDHFGLGFVPVSIAPGTPFAFSVTALDTFGNAASGYTGVVHFSSSDPAALLPPNSSLTNGAGLFAAMLKTPGTQSLTVSDATTGSIATSANINVLPPPGVATHFVVSAGLTQADFNATAGNAFVFGVTARDVSNNVATGFSGTVQFSSSDPQAFLPSGVSFTNGVGFFAAILRTAGVQTISAAGLSEAVAINGTSNNVTISHAALHHFGISTPLSAITGSEFGFTVAAQDAFNNTFPIYAGTVQFSSSDPAAILPSNATLTAGVGTFKATLLTPGSRTISAADSTTASITGTSPAIAARGLVVTAITPTSSGFTATFNKPFDPTPINLYDLNSALGPADVTLARNTVQSITFADSFADGSTFALAFNGATTGPITYARTNIPILQANLQNALDALPTIGPGNSSVSASSSFIFRVMFQNAKGFQPMALMSASPGSPTIAIAATTVGSSNLRGSVVLEDDHKNLTFLVSGVATAGILVPDTYQVTIRSAANAFKDELGSSLDGNNDGVSGDSYVSTFVVSSTALVLSTPDFARGPDSNFPIRVPNNVGEEVQRITFGGTSNGSTFELVFNGATAAAITYSTIAATLQSNIQAALDSLGNIDNSRRSGSLVTVTNATAATVRFQNLMGGFNQPQMTTTTPTVSISTTTQGINTGIPVTIANSFAFPNVTFDLHYDPEILTITGAYSTLEFTSFTLVGTPSNGVAQFDFHFIDFSAAGPLGALSTVGHIVAHVPDTAPYNASQLLRLDNILATSAKPGAGNPTIVASDAVHITAFFGDTNGDGALTGGDAGLVSRVNSNLDSIPGIGQVGGLGAYPLIDPFIFMDFNNTGVVDASDVTLINSYLVRSQTQIPTLPPPPEILLASPVASVGRSEMGAASVVSRSMTEIMWPPTATRQDLLPYISLSELIRSPRRLRQLLQVDDVAGRAFAAFLDSDPWP